MTPRPLSLAVLSQIGAAIASALADRSQREVGAIVGRDHTAIGRRGSDPEAWPLPDALRLALVDQGLRDLLVIALTGADAPRGEAVRVVSDIWAEVMRMGDATRSMAQAMEDGRIDAREAGMILTDIEARRRFEEERLIPDLRALAGRAP